MASILGDGTGPGGPGPSRCLLLLQRSLAIQLTRGPPPHVTNTGQRESPKEHPADEMWMYDKGYNLFQVSDLRTSPRCPENSPPPIQLSSGRSRASALATLSPVTDISASNNIASSSLLRSEKIAGVGEVPRKRTWQEERHVVTSVDVVHRRRRRHRFVPST